LKISKQARREAKSLFRACQLNGPAGRKPRPPRRATGSHPNRTGTWRLFPISPACETDQQRRTAKVESAAPLTPDLQTGIRNNLSRLYGPGLNLSFGQDARSSAGLRIQIGSDVYDGSVQGRLRSLQESFSLRIYESPYAEIGSPDRRSQNRNCEANVGTVREAGDGIAKIEGLTDAMLNEMLGLRQRRHRHRPEP